VIDSIKARRDLGWSPRVTLAEGLQGVISWVERYAAEIEQHPWEYQHQA